MRKFERNILPLKRTILYVKTEKPIKIRSGSKKTTEFHIMLKKQEQ